MSGATDSIVLASTRLCRFCNLLGRGFLQHAFPMPYFREPADCNEQPLCGFHWGQLQSALWKPDTHDTVRRTIASASPGLVQEASAAIVGGTIAFQTFLQSSPKGIAWASQPSLLVRDNDGSDGEPAVARPWCLTCRRTVPPIGASGRDLKKQHSVGLGCHFQRQPGLVLQQARCELNDGHDEGSCRLAHWNMIDIWCDEHVHDVLLFLRLWTPSNSLTTTLRKPDSSSAPTAVQEANTVCTHDVDSDTGSKSGSGAAQGILPQKKENTTTDRISGDTSIQICERPLRSVDLSSLLSELRQRARDHFGESNTQAMEAALAAIQSYERSMQ